MFVKLLHYTGNNRSTIATAYVRADKIERIEATGPLLDGTPRTNLFWRVDQRPYLVRMPVADVARIFAEALKTGEVCDATVQPEAETKDPDPPSVAPAT